MRRATRPEAVLLGLLLLLIASFVVWFLSNPAQRSSDDGGAAGIRAASSPVTITGDVTGAIAPGAMMPLNLSLDNSNDFALSIDRITVSVQEVDAPRADAEHPCTSADFVVRQLSASAVLRLAANLAADLSGMGLATEHWPAVGMLDRPVNQDGCKGAFLTLGYEASGQEVHR